MFPRIKRQTGNLYIVAIFVIVVMGFLATALSRMEWSNSDSLTKELLGTRAWFAAHSVNEYVLTQMYPLNQPEKVSEICSNIGNNNQQYASFMLADFQGCGLVEISCSPKSNNGLLVYKIDTAVQCGSGQYLVERQQEVWVKE